MHTYLPIATAKQHHFTRIFWVCVMIFLISFQRAEPKMPEGRKSRLKDIYYASNKMANKINHS